VRIFPLFKATMHAEHSLGMNNENNLKCPKNINNWVKEQNTLFVPFGSFGENCAQT